MNKNRNFLNKTKAGSRFLALLLSGALLFTNLMSSNIYAAEDATKAETKAEAESKTDSETKAGTESKTEAETKPEAENQPEVEIETIEIRTPEDLLELSRNCTLDTWSSNKAVVLKSDLDLTDASFSPIPLFAGTFNGGGHTIRGLDLSAGLSYAGLFRQVLPGAEIRYLLVEGTINTGNTSEFVGGIAGINYGTITGCSFTGDIAGFRSVGGIAGKVTTEGLIENCTVSGSIQAEHRAGGIAGESDGIIRQCMNQASVNVDLTEPSSGGLLSELTSLSSLSIQDLTKNLSQTEQSGITDLGGICGYSSGVLRDSMNSGAVGHSRVGYNVGGITGYSKGIVSGCMNSGIVQGRNDVGGITGQIDPDVSWTFSTEKIDGMRSRLNAVRDNIDKLADDANKTTQDLSRDLTQVMASVDDAGNALEDITNETVDFVNANIDTINAFSSRIHYGIGELGGVLGELSGFTERLPGTMNSLASAMDALQQSVQAADSGLDIAAAGIGAATSDINGSRQMIKDMKSILGTFAGDPSLDDIRPMLSELRQKMAGIRSNTEDAVTQILSLSGALSAFSNAGEPLAAAMNQTATASRQLSDALTYVDQAEKHLAGIFDTLGRYDALAFSHLGGDGSARTRLFAALGNANHSVQNIIRGLGESVLIEDAKAISDSLFELINYLLDSVTGTASLQDLQLMRDVSEEVREDQDGSVIGCTNLGAVTGETNVGGIAGSMMLDFSLDLDQEFNLSSLLTGDAKLELYAAVRDCTGLSVVTAMKSAAGGITGRMDYGAILSCQATGQVSALSSYAGGITGLSSGIVKNCSARAGLMAGDYMGGIAGQGHDIISCLSIPSFMGKAAFIGAVAGDTDDSGVYNGNYYAGSAEGAVNGFSFTGKAEEISYDELLKKSGESELFKSVVVMFMGENELVEQVSVDFGGRVKELPKVPDKDGKYWKWQDFDNTAIFNSMVVTGSYVSPLSSLSAKDEEAEEDADKKAKDGEEDAALSKVLLEGTFLEEDKLTYVRLSDKELDVCLENLPEETSTVFKITELFRRLLKQPRAYDAENLLDSGKVELLRKSKYNNTRHPNADFSRSGDNISEEDLKYILHIYAPEKGKLFIQGTDGTMKEASFTRDKNYILTDIYADTFIKDGLKENHVTYLYFKDKPLIWPYVTGTLILVLLIIVISAVTRHHRRRKELLKNDSDEDLLNLYDAYEA